MIGPVGMAAQGIGLEPRWGYVKLKYLLESVGSGGTPNTDVTSYWAENGEDGFPWVAIADMSRTSTVSTTAKRVSPDGLRSKGLAVWPSGTLLMSMYASLGHVATLGVPAATNQAILALHPRNNVDPGFLRYWLTAIRPLLKGEANSNTQDNLNAEKVANLPATKPPLEEQRRIAEFLDHETARIDELVHEQERLIELLDEDFEAQTHMLVTQGTTRDVATRRTGNPWFPQIPAHWRTTRLRWVVGSIKTGPFGSELHAEDYVPLGTPLINPASIGPRGITEENASRVDDETLERLKDYRIRAGDIVLGRRGQMGRSALVTEEQDGWLLGTGSMRIRSAKNMNAEYLNLLLGSRISRSYLELEAVGSTMSNLNPEILGGLPMPLPPIEEQEVIVGKFSEAQALVDESITAAQSSMALLLERRSALISAAVTGKLDLRNWQPHESERVAEVA